MGKDNRYELQQLADLAYQASKIESMTEFCMEYGIPYQTFIRWHGGKHSRKSVPVAEMSYLRLIARFPGEIRAMRKEIEVERLQAELASIPRLFKYA